MQDAGAGFCKAQTGINPKKLKYNVIYIGIVHLSFVVAD